MGVRLLLTAHIRPSKALEPGGRSYFSRHTDELVQSSTSKIGKTLESRIRTRIESEEFGAKSKFGHGDHTGRTVTKLSVFTPGLETVVGGKSKGTQLKVYISNPSMPWPLMTNWPIGVPGSRHQGGPMIIRPRKDRRSTGKSRKKRLTFFWKNAGVNFWGPKVKWPGFGPDVLTEELKAVQPILMQSAKVAVSKSVFDWAEGGSRNKPSTTVLRR